METLLKNVKGELTLVTVHCPVFVTDSEYVTFALLKQMLNGHVLQLHHKFVVCCLYPTTYFQDLASLRIFFMELYAEENHSLSMIMSCH
jgi:hypothetical protein